MEALKARLAAIAAQIAELECEEADLRQQLAEAQTDIKVGDRVKIEGKDAVWEISSIRPGHNNQPKYLGRKIKKDGTPGARICELFLRGRNVLVVTSDA